MFEHFRYTLRSEINHWMTAFGGGALLSAVTFALLPRGMEYLSPLPISLLFLGGTFTFMYIDMFMESRGSSLAQLISMLSDFIPEAIALGASFAHDNRFGLILALFIGLQNFPEGFNSYLELKKNHSTGWTLFIMGIMSFIGIGAALLGDFLLTNRPALIGGIMVYAAGGILYLIFQDIAPLSRKKADWIPATGASVGFLIGIIGEKLL